MAYARERDEAGARNGIGGGSSRAQRLHRVALEGVGTELEARLVRKVTALGPDPNPYDVIWTVLCERLPLTKRRLAQTQVMVAWLGRVAVHHELNDYLVTGTIRLRDYLADQLRAGQQRGLVRLDLDPTTTAEALLGLNEGLAAQLAVGLHTPSSSKRVLASHLELLSCRHQETG